MNLQNTIAKNRLASLWRLLAGNRWAYFGAILCMGLAAAARAGSYLFLGYFIDHILKIEGFVSFLPYSAAVFVGLALVEAGFTFLAKKEAARISERVVLAIREYIYDHIQRLTFSYHDQAKTGELIQRATSDVDAVRRLFADQVINAGRILALFLVNFCVLLTLQWRLTLFSVIFVPFTVVFAFFFFKRISAAYESFQEQEAVLSAVLQENLTGVRVVKAFARQDYEIKKFDRENWEKYLRGRRLLFMQALYWPSSDVLTGTQMLAGFFLGAVMAIHGEITVGTYVSFAGLLIWIVWPIRNLGQLIVEMSKGIVSYQRVLEIVKAKQEDLTSGDYTPQKIAGQITFKDVCFSYDESDGQDVCKDNPILQNISFSCKPGDLIALMGSTGSGKTTLANLLPRFYDYTSGSILLDGVELNRYPRTFLRHQIGIVEQEPFLFSRTIGENIAYGVSRTVSEEEIVAAARAAAIHDDILSFPQGYATIVGEKGVTLSGGQKQRVAIARTLIKNPRILILDDATSSVDTETEAEIRLALENLMQGRTTFIIAHRIQSVMQADQILVLDQGQIVQRGTHAQLMEEEGIYRQIFNIQTRIESALEKEVGRLGSDGALRSGEGSS